MPNLPKPEIQVFSVPSVAAALGTNVNKIRTFIHSGQLKAINLSSGPRPRWRITADALNEFLELRSAKTPRVPSTRRRHSSAKVEEFF